MQLHPLIRTAVTPSGWCLALLVFALGITVAQAVTISPVSVELSPARRVVSITMTNSGDQTLRYQSKMLAWRQVDGLDQYDATDDLIVAPAIFEIPAATSQIVRVTLRRPATGREQAYRLVFEDVSALKDPTADGAAIQFRVDHDLPVFAAAPGNSGSVVQVAPCQGVTGACVRLVNAGDRNSQIKSLTVNQGTWHKDLPVNTRILAGAWRQWPLEIPPGTRGPIKVSAQTRDGIISGELSVPGP